MARKKNAEDVIIQFVGYVLLVLFTLAYVSFVLSPVIFLVLYLYNQIQYLSVDRKRKEYFFWLTKSERQMFKENTEAYEKALGMKAYVEMAVEKEGIRLNQNGQISVRSYRGRDLKSYLDNANSVIGRLGPELEELSNRPRKQRKSARKHYSNAYAFGLSLPVLFCSIYSQLHTFDVSVVAEHVKVAPEIGYEAIVSMLVVGGVIKMICSIVFSVNNGKPPVVTLENVDSYLIQMIQKRKAKEIAAKRERLDDGRKVNSISASGSAVPVAGISGESAVEPSSESCAMSSSESVEKNVGQPVMEHASADIGKQSVHEPYEKSMFRIWAGLLKKKGYSLSGNWENWDNCAQWKNVSVEVSISQVNLLAAIEYDAGSNRIYFGITKHEETDSVSKTLQGSNVFRQFMKENGMTLKNNEWWYCLRHSTFDNVFSQYERMLNNICKMS